MCICIYMYMYTVHTLYQGSPAGRVSCGQCQAVEHSSLSQTCVACVVQCRVPTDLTPAPPPSTSHQLSMPSLPLCLLPTSLLPFLSASLSVSLFVPPTHFLSPSLPKPESSKVTHALTGKMYYMCSP